MFGARLVLDRLREMGQLNSLLYTPHFGSRPSEDLPPCTGLTCNNFKPRPKGGVFRAITYDHVFSTQ